MFLLTYLNDKSLILFLQFCVQISYAKLASITRSDEQREFRSLGQHPTYFHWENGRVVRIFLSDDDSTFAANIKKGIVGMFQLSFTDGEHSEVSHVYCHCFTITVTIILNSTMLLRR